MKITAKDLLDLADVEVIDVVDQDDDFIVTLSIYRDRSDSVKCKTVNDLINCRIFEEYIVNLTIDKEDISSFEKTVRSKDFEYVQTKLEVKIEDRRYDDEDLLEMIELEIIEMTRSREIENSVYVLRFEDE